MGFGSLAFPEESLYHLPFGTKDAYVREIMAADLDKLANLIDLRVPDADKNLLVLGKRVNVGLSFMLWRSECGDGLSVSLVRFYFGSMPCLPLFLTG
jgi:hypothetical protein